MYKINLLILCIIREPQTGNLRPSVGRQHAFVSCTLRIRARGRGKGISDRFQAPGYLCGVDHNWQIKSRKHRTSGNTHLWIGSLLTGTSFVKGRWGLQTVKRVFSKRMFGGWKHWCKLKAIKSESEVKWSEWKWIVDMNSKVNWSDWVIGKAKQIEVKCRMFFKAVIFFFEISLEMGELYRV